MKNYQKGFATVNILLVILAIIVVGGAAYYLGTKNNSAPQSVVDNTYQPTTENQNSKKTTPPTKPVSKNQVYSNEYMKVTIPEGWTATEAKNPSAVNITKGNYILYINTQASQASGAEGGRFAEIGMGAPSVDAVMKEEPMPPCGTSEKNPATAGHPRADLYVSASADNAYCNIPSNGKNVWYFSYITDNNGTYFNYYKTGNLAYVITMAYNSKDVNSFPAKGSPTLNSMLDEMTTIVKSLEIKQQ